MLKREVAISAPATWPNPRTVIILFILVSAVLAAPVVYKALQIAKADHGSRMPRASVAPAIVFVLTSDASANAPATAVIHDGDWHAAARHGLDPDLGTVRHLCAISTATGRELFHSTVRGKVTRSGDDLYWWDADGNYRQLSIL
jgi:hypothetical protein